jgi:hypothetical protein
LVTSLKKKRKKKRKGHYVRGTYTSPIAGECRYRSGWELKVMVYLDENPEVEFWSYEKTVIEYVSNVRTKKIRKYYPDFLVKYKDGRTELIEVKPKRKLEQLTVKKKAEAAKSWCETNGLSYKILTEFELKELGLL